LIDCPRCKNEDCNEGKSWNVVPKTGKGKAMRVTLYSCSRCSNKFRKGVRIDAPSISAVSPKMEGVMKSESVSKPIPKPDIELSRTSARESLVTLRTGAKISVDDDIIIRESLFERIKRGLGF